ncbi:MAG: OmpA family protein [Deltaproteobacteria bacterium]|nr:OmpA family protein [Deltaproteobacteria bacterium]
MVASIWMVRGLVALGAADVAVLNLVVAPRALGAEERQPHAVAATAPARAVVAVAEAPRAVTPAPVKAPPAPVVPERVEALPPVAEAPPPVAVAEAPPAPVVPAAAVAAAVANPDAPPPIALYYPTDHASIYPTAERDLDRAIATLEASPALHVVVTGRADPRGPDRYNHYLSSRRAKRVVRYLVDHGVPPERIERVALGEREADRDGTPLDDAEALRRERRVDLTFTWSPP